MFLLQLACRLADRFVGIARPGGKFPFALFPINASKCEMLVVVSPPVQGQVRYRLSDVLSATTNFRATIHLAAIGQIGARKTDSPSLFSPPELLTLHVQISRLDISNDLLNLGRALVEDLVNHELRDNEARIREKANNSIRKALEKHPVRLPLLQFLGL